MPSSAADGGVPSDAELAWRVQAHEAAEAALAARRFGRAARVLRALDARARVERCLLYTSPSPRDS